jgi:hypothetical protein
MEKVEFENTAVRCYMGRYERNDIEAKLRE